MAIHARIFLALKPQEPCAAQLGSGYRRRDTRSASGGSPDQELLMDQNNEVELCLIVHQGPVEKVNGGFPQALAFFWLKYLGVARSLHPLQDFPPPQPWTRRPTPSTPLRPQAQLAATRHDLTLWSIPVTTRPSPLSIRSPRRPASTASARPVIRRCTLLCRRLRPAPMQATLATPGAPSTASAPTPYGPPAAATPLGARRSRARPAGR